jgi:hypothetical protein
MVFVPVMVKADKTGIQIADRRKEYYYLLPSNHSFGNRLPKDRSVYWLVEFLEDGSIEFHKPITEQEYMGIDY